MISSPANTPARGSLYSAARPSSDSRKRTAATSLALFETAPADRLQCLEPQPALQAEQLPRVEVSHTGMTMGRLVGVLL